MKIKYIVLSSFAILILFVTVYINYESKYSKDAIIARENLQNVQKVIIGMDTSQVLGIMGHPIDKRFYKGELFYDYEVPSGLSLQCQIIFDSLGLVTYISPEPERLE